MVFVRMWDSVIRWRQFPKISVRERFSQGKILAILLEWSLGVVFCDAPRFEIPPNYLKSWKRSTYKAPIR
jgi:hypothetical protein